MSTKNIVKKVKNFLDRLLATFRMRKWSKWIDLDCFEGASGRCYLMQMQIDLDTNKKRFRRVSMGFVQFYDYTSKKELYEKAKKYNAEDFLE